MYPLLVILLSLVKSAVTVQKVDPLVKVFSENTAFRKAPDLKVMEACQTTKTIGAIDVWVP